MKGEMAGVWKDLKKAEKMAKKRLKESKSGGIQVEMPRWVAKDKDGKWFCHSTKPRILECNEFWGVYTSGTRTKVTGFTGDWKGSLHQWNGSQWVKV